MEEKYSEILKFCQFLKDNPNEVEKIKDIKEPNSLIDFAKENGFNFSLEDLSDYKKSVNRLSDDDLLDVAGGISKKEMTRDFLVLMMGLGLPFSVSMSAGASPLPYNGGGVNSVISQNINEEHRVRAYFGDEEISQAQRKSFDIIQKVAGRLVKDKNKLFSSNEWDKINSYRSFRGSRLTEVEQMLDEAVDKGDVPIKAFKIEEIDKESKNVKDDSKGIPTTFEVRRGVDALNLSEKCARDGSIVQVASQFNALESPGAYFSPVCNWPSDRTQGPRASLQSIAAAKHRESAYLKHKLPDAIQGLLKKCKLKDGKSILEKYPDLYSHGYLELYRVADTEDLKVLGDFLKNNIGQMNFLSQWVKCDDNGKKQLQVFSAAPSFQNVKMDWSKNDRTKLLGEICKAIVVSEYRAIAKVAKIRASATGKQTDVHFTLVGQGVFNNPKDTVDEIVKCLKEEFEGTHNIRVVLHAYNDPWSWTTPLKNNGVAYTQK